MRDGTLRLCARGATLAAVNTRSPHRPSEPSIRGQIVLCAIGACENAAGQSLSSRIAPSSGSLRRKSSAASSSKKKRPWRFFGRANSRCGVCTEHDIFAREPVW
ncbi:hypothetical protein KC338_g175 [Hortaea werneckii]|nr:hypothetical protein KC338_g175 [Hortaea werneckii]